MPIATIHVLEGRYDERRLTNVSKAVQDALISILKIPSDDFFQIIHVLPRNRFLHTPSFLGMKYSDDFILLELAFISGRPKETRLALLKELNARIVAGAGISPDDLMIQLSEFPGENFSFGQGLAQRAVHLTGSLRTPMDSTQTEVILRRFETPGDVREMVKGRFEIVRLGGLTIGRATYQPGWIRAGDLFYIPPDPHDSWVVGDELYVSLHFLGAEHYAR